ncbi:MAG: type II toxin-antitoxin system VapC family toxin [Proteobacteria bacterium]|nr:type II toxin-antitoxin system VapC family toxin [Pseudomonadota bacterium]
MGMKPLIYLDTCIVIYLVEEHPIYQPTIEAVLSDSFGVVCHSPLVELEALVLPLRLERNDLLAKFRIFFSINRSLHMPYEVFQHAAELRARFSLKTPDALHLATAQYHGCTEFWTNDDRLRNVAGSLAVNVCGGMSKTTLSS